jgi:hypothetical protein
MVVTLMGAKAMPEFVEGDRIRLIGCLNKKDLQFICGFFVIQSPIL